MLSVLCGLNLQFQSNAIVDVYEFEIDDITMLKTRIIQTIERVTRNMLARVCQNTVLLMVTKWAQVEMLQVQLHKL